MRKQALEDDRVHGWYRFVLAFPDHLVRDLLERFSVGQDEFVLDPFCGTGTTLVECVKAGIDTIGFDANPASAFASSVKLDYEPTADNMRDVLGRMSESWGGNDTSLSVVDGDPLAESFVESGMIDRGWISEQPLSRCIQLLRQIEDHDETLLPPLGFLDDHAQLLMLALVDTVVGVSNVNFGPELYCAKPPREFVDVEGEFTTRVERMIEDLEWYRGVHDGSVYASADTTDARLVHERFEGPMVDVVITSPPYPTEKDYTRNTRLEMMFVAATGWGGDWLLGEDHIRDIVRGVKKEMIRSHSKGIYKADNDAQFVSHIPEVQSLSEELAEASAEKTYGFAKVYPRIPGEYFGGMWRHLESLRRIMNDGGRCAYVVGQQCCYLGVHIKTAEILGIIAEQVGFEVEGIDEWRMRKGSTGKREIAEEILFLRKRW